MCTWPADATAETPAAHVFPAGFSVYARHAKTAGKVIAVTMDSNHDGGRRRRITAIELMSAAAWGASRGWTDRELQSDSYEEAAWSAVCPTAFSQQSPAGLTLRPSRSQKNLFTTARPCDKSRDMKWTRTLFQTGNKSSLEEFKTARERHWGRVLETCWPRKALRAFLGCHVIVYPRGRNLF